MSELTSYYYYEDRVITPATHQYRVYHADEADKVIARQKKKRCLAMAKLCHWKMGVFIYKEEKNEFYYRWYKRWWELAERFK